MKNISKQFPGVKALDQVSIDLYEGEVLALLGENGAGKSTLLKTLSGVYTADSGKIFLDNAEKNFRTPADAAEAGISIIYQELNYISDLTVAENIFVGRIPVKGIMKKVDWKRMYEDAQKALETVGADINPGELMMNLSVAEKQLVEIARAVSKNMRVLVMDEPTAALNDREVEKLLVLVRKLAEMGVSVIYISHRLDELFKVADRVTVLRDGKYIGSVNIDKTNKSELVSMMVGRDISDMYPKQQIPISDKVFEVEGLNNGQLKDISFYTRKGEILGIFGLMGSGRSKLAKTIFGLEKPKSGKFIMENKCINIDSPEQAIKYGLAYVPCERKQEGLILCQSVKQNVLTANLDKVSRLLGILDLEAESELAGKWVDTLGVKTPGIETIIEALSGGNQQKVVLAKWLVSDPKVLILNEPTRGIDVGAKVEIYRIMEELCAKGLSIIMISSELPEILALSDRVIVLSNGRITGEINREEACQENLMHCAIGGY